MLPVSTSEFFQKSNKFNLLREMDKVASYIEYGLWHSYLEKASRLLICINPRNSAEEKTSFLAESDKRLDYYKEMSCKTSYVNRKLVAEEFILAVKKIFSADITSANLDKLISIEKVKREDIKRKSKHEDCFNYRVVINMPNFYNINRGTNYNWDSMNIFGIKYKSVIEAFSGSSITLDNISQIPKTFVIAEADSYDDKKNLTKFSKILDGIISRKSVIENSLNEMYKSLHLTSHAGSTLAAA